jgi:hypothetical protein
MGKASLNLFCSTQSTGWNASMTIFNVVNQDVAFAIPKTGSDCSDNT